MKITETFDMFKNPSKDYLRISNKILETIFKELLK